MIHGERVLIREWKANELVGMHRWLSDPMIKRFLSWGASSIEESDAHLKEVLEFQNAEPRRNYYLAVELKESGRTIGDAGFTWIEDTLAEIGYFLEPTYWGSGYATESAKLIIQCAFERGAKSVFATCDGMNSNSENVMKRCGMKRQHSDNPQRLVYSIQY